MLVLIAAMHLPIDRQPVFKGSLCYGSKYDQKLNQLIEAYQLTRFDRPVNQTANSSLSRPGTDQRHHRIKRLPWLNQGDPRKKEPQSRSSAYLAAGCQRDRQCRYFRGAAANVSKIKTTV